MKCVHVPIVLSLVVGALMLPLILTAQEETPAFSASLVHMMADETEVASTVSVLVREVDEVAMMLHVGGLTPGDAVTTWWVIFNNPAACSPPACGSDDLPHNDGDPAVQAAMLYADGQVIDEDGQGHFTARLRVGDTSGAALFVTPGLVDIDQAEIHLVARTHGPALPDLVDAQLSTLNGGCVTGDDSTGTPGPNTCTNLMGSIHLPSQ